MQSFLLAPHQALQAAQLEIEACSVQPSSPPRLARWRPIDLPVETFPFHVSKLLEFASPLLLASIDLALARIATLPPFALSEPATNPATNAIRIVHPLLDRPILIQAAHRDAILTVQDVLVQLSQALWEPVSQSVVPQQRRSEFALAFQERCMDSRLSPSFEVTRRIDLLQGATRFAGLRMDVPVANRMVGDIDCMQALTWILEVKEP